MIDLIGLDSCILTYKVKIQVRFKDETKRWMPDSERDYMSGLKTSIEDTFNNNSYKFVPEVHNEDQCPCCNGFTPKVKLEVVKEPSRFSGDYDWFIKAHADDAGNRRASSTVGFHNGLFMGGRGKLYPNSLKTSLSYWEENSNGKIDKFYQNPAAHEVGHGLGLNHPGKGIEGNKPNEISEYIHSGEDIHGNKVDGKTDLMGVRNGLRPFYSDKWKQYLNKTYKNCNYKQS